GWYEHSQRRDAEVPRPRGRGRGEPAVRRKTPALAGAAALAATVAAVVMSGAKHATAAAQEPPPNTATVQRGTLSDMISQYGTLTYRARSDGSRYAVIHRARGTYTKLPNSGD